MNQHEKPHEIFWGELAPCEHLVHCYSNSGEFLPNLVTFATGGLHRNESVVVVATPAHRTALETGLAADGFDVPRLRRSDQYVDLDAADTLRKFMRNDWPDDRLFVQTIRDVLSRARGSGSGVRVFGEMVALLWAGGLHAATVRLEHLWTNFCTDEGVPLLCAYPRQSTSTLGEAFSQVVAAHSRQIT